MREGSAECIDGDAPIAVVAFYMAVGTECSVGSGGVTGTIARRRHLSSEIPEKRKDSKFLRLFDRLVFEEDGVFN